jgi:AcrR family transcriptional regulator
MAVRGRPRAFDKKAALRRAMEVFWKKGYEGASLTDLTTAMGINAPSMYGTFGSKEELFRQALKLYNQEEGAGTEEALKEPHIEEVIKKLFKNHLKALSSTCKPRGCMVVLAAPHFTEENRELRKLLADYRKHLEVVLRDRLKKAIADGELHPSTNIAAIAAFYNAVLQGLSIQARDGVSKRTLQMIADSAIAAWSTLSRPAG